MFKTMMRIEMIEMSEMITWKEEQVRRFFKSTNYSANNISKQLILKKKMEISIQIVGDNQPKYRQSLSC